MPHGVLILLLACWSTPARGLGPETTQESEQAEIEKMKKMMENIDIESAIYEEFQKKIEHMEQRNKNGWDSHRRVHNHREDPAWIGKQVKVIGQTHGCDAYFGQSGLAYAFDYRLEAYLVKGMYKRPRDENGTIISELTEEEPTDTWLFPNVQIVLLEDAEKWEAAGIEVGEFTADMLKLKELEDENAKLAAANKTAAADKVEPQALLDETGAEPVERKEEL